MSMRAISITVDLMFRLKVLIINKSKGDSHNSVLTVHTVLFISIIVRRRIQFRINRRMDGYHYETLRNRTEDDLIKFYEISYKRKHYIHKQRHGRFQIKACTKLETVSQ